MTTPRIDVIVEGPEGGWIARALRTAGFSPVRRSLDETGEASTSLVVVAAEGDEEAWTLISRARRGASADVPVIVVAPPDAPIVEPARALAQAIYPRPVPVARLVRKVQTFVASGSERLTRAPEPATPEPPREPTIRLREDTAPRVEAEDDEESGETAPPPAGGSSRPPTARARRSSSPPSAPNTDLPRASVDSSIPPPSEMTQPVAELSPWLERMLVEADRRVFPASAALDLRFMAGELSAEELVPEALLEEYDVARDVADEDPAAALTFVGAAVQQPHVPRPAPVPRPLEDESTVSPRKRDESGVLRGRRHSDIPSVPPLSQPSIDSAPPPSIVETAADLPYTPLPALQVGQPSADGRGKLGVLGRGGGAVLAIALRDAQGPTRLSLRPPGQEPLVLHLGPHGALLRLDGDVARRAVLSLGDVARRAAAPTTEVEARRQLAERAAHHPAALWEVTDAVQQAGRTALFDALSGDEVSFELYPIDRAAAPPAATHPTPGEMRLTGRLVEYAFAAVASRIDRDVARRRLEERVGGGVVQVLHDVAPLLHESRVDPALAAVVLDIHGRGLEAVVGPHAPDGVPGIVWALEHAGFIGVAPASEQSRGIELASVRQLVTAAYDASREGNYFELLALRPEAGRDEVHSAYHAKSTALLSCDLRGAGLEDLEALRDDVLACYDDARDVLQDDALRAAYARAIFRTP